RPGGGRYDSGIQVSVTTGAWGNSSIRPASTSALTGRSYERASRHHPGQHGRGLQPRDDAQQHEEPQAPQDHAAEDVAFFAVEGDRGRSDREVLRRDHLAEHAARTV